MVAQNDYKLKKFLLFSELFDPYNSKEAAIFTEKMTAIEYLQADSNLTCDSLNAVYWRIAGVFPLAHKSCSKRSCTDTLASFQYISITFYTWRGVGAVSNFVAEFLVKIKC